MGIIALGGGSEKNIFLASSQTIPRSLSSFDTYGRWQPVTQSTRSRRSYGKIGDSEQSTYIGEYPTPRGRGVELTIIEQKAAAIKEGNLR